jgi:CubicO group peptidase (beta-lactamase class C family)
LSRFLSRRTVVLVLLVLLAVALLVLLVWMAVAGPVTVLRILRYGDTDIDDYTHYPGRVLVPGGSASSLPSAGEEMAVPDEALAALALAGDLGPVLEANDTIAFLVLQGGTVVYERYYQGHGPSSLSQIFSVSKSFTSALAGLAIEDGLFEGVDQPITDLIPELEEGFDAVTLGHLLAMTSGSDYRENDNPFGEHVILNYTPRLEPRILAISMEAEPGTVFRYKSGDNALLGLALRRALAPETITGYAQRRLWVPLGMQDRGVWSLDHAGDGLEKTWCCLALSPRDLTRFGQLYLQGGGGMVGRSCRPPGSSSRRRRAMSRRMPGPTSTGPRAGETMATSGGWPRRRMATSLGWARMANSCT